MANYQKRKRPWLVLAIALCIILVSSFVASMIQSSYFSVTVTQLNDVSNQSTMEVPYTNITDGVSSEAYVATIEGNVASGILFVPKSASITSKRPAIVLTHGYLNSKELQLQNAIELARRGFIVLTIDRGGHGDNQLETDESALYNTSGMYDAAKYLFNLPWCNGQIGISGHSMGGYTTVATLSADNKTTANAGSRTEENKATFTGNNLGIVSAALIQAFDPYPGAGPNVSVGILKAKDDEFFFKSKDVNGNDTISREFLTSVAAANFVSLSYTTSINIRSGDIYVGGSNLGPYANGTKASAGFRVIYEADEIHPQNHFSIESAGYVVNFFYTAFGVPNNSSFIRESDQVWWLKEIASGVGLLGFFMLAIPLIDLLLSASFFKGLKKKQSFFVGPGTHTLPLVGVHRHFAYWVVAIATTLFAGLSIQWVMSREGILHWVTTFLFRQGANFPQDTTGTVASWAITCGVFAIVACMFFYLINLAIDKLFKLKTRSANPFDAARLERGFADFVKTILLAGITVALMYGVLFVTWNVGKVDFRVWTFAVRAFEVQNMLPMMLRYMIPFFVFYAINSIFNQSYRAENIPEWLTTIINCFFNVAGILAAILIQYIVFRDTGVLWQSDMALNYIVLFPIVPILVIATLYSRRLYARTGNAWLGAVLNTMLFTIITCASTASSFVSNPLFF